MRKTEDKANVKINDYSKLKTHHHFIIVRIVVHPIGFVWFSIALTDIFSLLCFTRPHKCIFMNATARIIPDPHIVYVPALTNYIFICMSISYVSHAHTLCVFGHIAIIIIIIR